jgi:hypothetical protein
MILVQIAAYILIITAIVVIASHALWLVFFLFAFRFWEAVISKAWMAEHLHVVSAVDYRIIILIIAAITYFAVHIATNQLGAGLLKYIFLLVMALYVFRHYTFEDIFFLKDYLTSKGMWSMDYWITQGKNVFSMKENTIVEVFKSIGQNIADFCGRLWGYVHDAK